MKLKTFVVLASLLSLGVSLQAQERLVPKQLAGPIEEIQTGVMAPVDPVETGIRSKSAMIPVDLRPAENGAWSWQGSVAVDAPSLNMVLFSGDESWSVELRQPGAKSLAPARELATEVRRSSLGLGNESFEGDHYRFEAARAGEWTVAVSAPSTKVSGPEVRRGYLLYSTDSPYRVLSYKTASAQLVGGEIGFTTFGFEKVAEGPGSEVNAGLLDEAWLRIKTPAGEERLVAMTDGGDGLFAGSFSADLAGEYHVQVVARGVTPEGLVFERTAEHVVPVIESLVAPALDYASSRLVDEKRLEVSLAVENRAGAPEKYRVFAEVWGASPGGEMRPISWIGGMSYVENGRLDLGLDLRWIGRAGAVDSFELRNVRLEDPDTFIPVLRLERMDLLTPSLPPIARAAVKSLDEEMLMGPRPQQAASKAGSRLLLVHGYCSGDAWGPVSGQFTGESIFLDLNKNRSHDTFANLIASFGSSYSSYGIVAHSQGGAASLHLYTYYWSGLDYASSGRLIQSVGTPYQGTALAGNAAVLGDIFGVGCGTNTDLTYSGASSWLSGVPSWARSAVNYYTTSFTDKWWRYDYCHLVTDLLLSDPDDGTTERAYGQLSGAVNRGHKTGWCHTNGMRDPNQVTDSNRNSTMNANAAR